MGVVAIIGRPNVGKSTLFNRLLRRQAAIVLDEPGVTRDRNYAVAEHAGRRFTVIDTGGFDPLSRDDTLTLMREQALAAIADADAIVVLFDGRDGPTAVDEAVVESLRGQPRPVFYAVNKVDTPAQQALLGEFYRLGAVPQLYALSALGGNGVWELLDDVVAALGETDEPDDADGEGVRVAVVGRPNVGKSTLINRLLGEERLLTSDRPGTTRDSIDTLCCVDDRRYTLIDTAGLRRKRAVDDEVERYAGLRAVRAIERADVILLLIDATSGAVDQDAQVARLINDRGRACVIVVNKWDLADRDPHFAARFLEDLRGQLPFLAFAPVVLTSALTGRNTTKLFPHIDKVYAAYTLRIATGPLNQALEQAIAHHHPPIYRNRRLKLYYWTQVATRPPTIVASVNYPDAVHASYQRYLLNFLREQFDFEGTPIRLRLRKRGREAE